MARLDEASTVATSIAQHVADHNQLHEKANYTFDVRDYGAVGDGSTDDTVAMDDCRDAAHAAGRGTMYLPLGTWMTDGLALTGTGINMRGEGPGTILKANTGITGAVLDCTGWVDPPHNIGHAHFRYFNIEGDGVSDAGKTHYGMDTTNVNGASFTNIGIRETGGPGWYANAGWGNVFTGIVIERPVAADTNDVPYVFFYGATNGNAYNGIGFRSYTADPDGSSLWLIEDDGTYISEKSTIKGTWIEYPHTAENGALLDFATNGWVIESPQVFDAGNASGTTNTAQIRFRDGVNGAGAAGGNEVWGRIPADTGSATSLAWGIDMLSDRNVAIGVKGYSGANVRFGAGVDYCVAILAGNAANSVGYVDDSGTTTNTVLDLATNDYYAGPDAGWAVSRSAKEMTIGRGVKAILTLGEGNGSVAAPNWEAPAGGSGQVYQTATALYFRGPTGARPVVVKFRGDGVSAPAIEATSIADAYPAIEARARSTHNSAYPVLKVVDASSAAIFEVLESGATRIMGGSHLLSGAGTPEGATAAPIGSLYMRTDGGANTSMYVKESGTGNTGWAAK